MTGRVKLWMTTPMALLPLRERKAPGLTSPMGRVAQLSCPACRRRMGCPRTPCRDGSTPLDEVHALVESLSISGLWAAASAAPTRATAQRLRKNMEFVIVALAPVSHYGSIFRRGWVCIVEQRYG